MKKALVLSGFLAAVALIVVVCLALSRERTPSPDDISTATPTAKESAPESFFYIDGQTVRSWSAGGQTSAQDRPGIMDIRSVSGGYIWLAHDGDGYVLSAHVKGEDSVIAHSGDSMDPIRTDGDQIIGYSTFQGVVVRSLATGESRTYPRASSWALVPGRLDIVSVEQNALTLHDGDTSTVLGLASSVVSVSGTEALIERAEKFSFLSLTTGKSWDVTPYADDHWVSTAVTEKSVVETFSRTDGGFSMDAYLDGRRIASTTSPGAIVQACSSPQSGYVVVAGSTNVSADYLEQNWHTEHPDGLGMVVYNARGERVATLTGGFSTWCPTTPLFWEHPLGHVH